MTAADLIPGRDYLYHDMIATFVKAWHFYFYFKLHTPHGHTDLRLSSRELTHQIETI